MNRPTLVEDWRKTLRKAWSVRLALFSAALSGAEFALPMLPDSIVDFIGHGRFALSAFLISIAAGIARIVAQPKMK